MGLMAKDLIGRIRPSIVLAIDVSTFALMNAVEAAGTWLANMVEAGPSKGWR